MSRKSLGPLCLLLIGGFGGLPAAAQPEADGLYAGLITSLGTFWCRLEFERAPRTVANFLTLAEGTRPWIDFPKAQIVQRPFYDGLTFHRVISGFMVQGGSPNGRGTDGPGYQFADEFHAELRHSQPGILSMANSGENSNGSQFFVTVTNTPWLDDVHSIFGEVVEGMDVVHAISQVPRDPTNDRPLTPVALQEVQILRRGLAAESFDPGAVLPALPAVRKVPVALEPLGEAMKLHLQPGPQTFLHVFASDDFTQWVYGSTKVAITNLDIGGFLGAPALSYPHVFLRALEGDTER